MSAPNRIIPGDEVFLGSVRARDAHAHLCPDCDQLWRCICADGWTVSYARCGCKAEKR